MLTCDQWKYEASKAAEGQGGRTHTFGVKNPASVLAKTVIYQAPLFGWREAVFGGCYGNARLGTLPWFLANSQSGHRIDPSGAARGNVARNQRHGNK